MSLNCEVISLFPSLWKALIFSQHYELNQADFLAKKSSWNQIIFWSGFELIFSRYLSRFLAHKLRWFSLDFWHIKLADFQRISDPENGVIFKEYLALKTSWYQRISSHEYELIFNRILDHKMKWFFRISSPQCEVIISRFPVQNLRWFSVYF